MQSIFWVSETGSGKQLPSQIIWQHYKSLKGPESKIIIQERQQEQNRMAVRVLLLGAESEGSGWMPVPESKEGFEEPTLRDSWHRDLSSQQGFQGVSLWF